MEEVFTIATDTTPKPDLHEFSLPAEPPTLVDSQPVEGAAGPRHFVRHFAEMFLAMMIGMMALGALESGILSAASTSVKHVRNSAPEVFALAMALNMTIGMTLWMRYRGHSWAMCGEMGAAMFAPAILAIVLFRAGVVDGPSAGGVLMGAMIPAMIAVMLLRRTGYSQPVHKHSKAPHAEDGGPRP